MDDSSATLAGRAIGALIIACLPLYFLARTLRSAAPSQRFANAALFCGLAMFLAPELVFGITTAENPSAARVFGLLRIAVGLVGLVFGVLAFVQRRRDGGTGIARPLLGCLFSVLHVMAGAFRLYLTSSVFVVPAPGSPDAPDTSWVYQAPDGAYRLTLPSDRWKEIKNSQGATMFVHPLPSMQAGVLWAVPGGEAEFRTAVSRFKATMDKQGEPATKLREGTNRHGHRYAYFVGTDRTEKGEEVFMATSFVWCADRKLVLQLLFEARQRMLSGEGKASETKLFEESAEGILLSVG